MPGPASEPAAAPEAHDRSVVRKREILAAASRVFRRKGLESAGMRDIAAELDMAVGNLYYYFENKEALLAFCQEDGLSGLLALAGTVRALPLGAGERLYLLIVGHVLRLNEGTPGALAHLEVEGIGGERREGILAKRRDYEQALRDLIEEGIAAGTFRAHDPKVAALAILGAVNWTVKWFRPDGGRSAAGIGAEFADLLVRGLLDPGASFAPPPLAPVLETATPAVDGARRAGRSKSIRRPGR